MHGPVPMSKQRAFWPKFLATLMMLAGLALWPQAREATAMAPATREGVASGRPGTVALRGYLSHGYVHQTGPTEVYASIELEAQEPLAARRKPMNIALVIDRSMSMQGQALEHARQASQQLVGMLGEGDRLSIVTYGSDVTVLSRSVVITPRERERLAMAIAGIQAQGWTNLSGGYQAGFELVRQHAKKGYVNRVLLMSDGHANQGITEPAQLALIAREGLSAGVSLSTFGFGLDYNENLMSAMAVEGAGNYYFVEDPWNLHALFARELEGLSRTVACNVRLVITLAPGVRLGYLHGFSYEQDGQRLIVPLAEFAARQRRDLLLRLSVPAGVAQRQALVDLKLEYDDVASERPMTSHIRLDARESTERARVDASIAPAVMARAEQVEIAQTMKQAMERYESGRVEEASRLLEDQRARTRQSRENDRFGAAADDFARAEEELQEMSSQIQAAPAASPQGKQLKKAKSARTHEILQKSEAF